MSILSKHYQTEIAVADTESGRVDRYGKMQGIDGLGRRGLQEYLIFIWGNYHIF